MRALWDADHPLTAKEVAASIPRPSPAHTTVLTALDRLREKGHVLRVGKDRRDIQFAPARPEEAHIGSLMLERLQTSSDRTAALLHFAGQLDDDAVAALRKALGKTRR